MIAGLPHPVVNDIVGGASNQPAPTTVSADESKPEKPSDKSADISDAGQLEKEPKSSEVKNDEAEAEAPVEGADYSINNDQPEKLEASEASEVPIPAASQPEKQ